MPLLVLLLTFLVNLKTQLLGHELCEVNREPKRIPQLEDILAVQDASLSRSSHLLEAFNALQCRCALKFKSLAYPSI